MIQLLYHLYSLATWPFLLVLCFSGALFVNNAKDFFTYLILNVILTTGVGLILAERGGVAFDFVAGVYVCVAQCAIVFIVLGAIVLLKRFLLDFINKVE